MRLLHLIEDNTMKIDEVQIQEAEPNYETDPAQARLSAIAVKLMDKAETVTDENLQIALSRVAQHLPEYGTAFGAKNMQELLDIVTVKVDMLLIQTCHRTTKILSRSQKKVS